MKTEQSVARIWVTAGFRLVIVLVSITIGSLAVTHDATPTADLSSVGCIPDDPEPVGRVISEDPEPVGHGGIDHPDPCSRVINDNPDPLSVGIGDGPDPFGGVISDAPDPITAVIDDGPDPFSRGVLVVCSAEGYDPVVQLVTPMGGASMVPCSRIVCVCLPIGSAMSSLE